MKKIVFIINAISNQRCIKRVNEFVDNGFDVVAYGFSRKVEMHNTIKVNLQIAGEYSNTLPYSKRLLILWHGIRGIINRHRNEDVVYYLFGLDISMVFKLICDKPFVYEESDLTHTYINNRLIRHSLEIIDRQIIKRSILAVFTSEGFMRYHFKDHVPANVCLVENKLNPAILDYAVRQKKPFDKSNISIGFVGGPRFKSIYHFIDVFCRNYPQFNFHVFGGPIPAEFEPLRNYPNCVFHGFFKNPDDLPEIYSSIDVVLSTYDVEYDNVKYAEPNKLYESIYFETPIIVSSDTFLAEKVRRLGVGYDIDPLNEQSIVDFVKELSEEKVAICQSNAQKISKRDLISINDHLFEKLKSAVSSIS